MAKNNKFYFLSKSDSNLEYFDSHYIKRYLKRKGSPHHKVSIDSLIKTVEETKGRFEKLIVSIESYSGQGNTWFLEKIISKIVRWKGFEHYFPFTIDDSQYSENANPAIIEKLYPKIKRKYFKKALLKYSIASFPRKINKVIAFLLVSSLFFVSISGLYFLYLNHSDYTLKEFIQQYNINTVKEILYAFFIWNVVFTMFCFAIDKLFSLKKHTYKLSDQEIDFFRDYNNYKPILIRLSKLNPRYPFLVVIDSYEKLDNFTKDFLQFFFLRESSINKRKLGIIMSSDNSGYIKKLQTSVIAQNKTISRGKKTGFFEYRLTPMSENDLHKAVKKYGIEESLIKNHTNIKGLLYNYNHYGFQRLEDEFDTVVALKGRYSGFNEIEALLYLGFSGTADDTERFNESQMEEMFNDPFFSVKHSSLRGWRKLNKPLIARSLSTLISYQKVGLLSNDSIGYFAPIEIRKIAKSKLNVINKLDIRICFIGLYWFLYYSKNFINKNYNKTYFLSASLFQLNQISGQKTIEYVINVLQGNSKHYGLIQEFVLSCFEISKALISTANYDQYRHFIDGVFRISSHFEIHQTIPPSKFGHFLHTRQTSES